jgi:hypothetical protein
MLLGLLLIAKLQAFEVTICGSNGDSFNCTLYFTDNADNYKTPEPIVYDLIGREETNLDDLFLEFSKTQNEEIEP